MEYFPTTIGDAKKKLSFYPKNVFDKIENKFMVTLSELETIFKISELLQGLWIKSKSSKRQNNHPAKTEEKVKRLKAKVLDLTRRYEGKLREKEQENEVLEYQVVNLTEQIRAAEKTCSEQHIQLEIKDESFEWQENMKKQLENQEEEIKSLKTKVDDLTKEVQMLKDCGKTKIYAE